MFCPNCGAQIPEGSKFCNRCGAAIDGAAPNPAQAETQDGPRLVQDPSLPEGIFRDDQGAYHWVYHMDMMRNPVPLFTIMKISGFICLGIGILVGGYALIDGADPADALKAFAVPALGINAFFLVLTLIAWFILMATRGGRYVFEFLMTEDKVVTLQTNEEKKKAQKLAKVTFALGLLDRNLSTMGVGMAALAGERFDSDFRDVKAVIAKRRQDLIKVNNVLQRNTIYAYPHQYEFVWNYITSHCPNAKIKG